MDLDNSRFSASEMLAIRLLQLSALAQDRDLTPAGDARAAKSEHLASLVQPVQELARELGRDEVAQLLSVDAAGLPAAGRDALGALRDDVRDEIVDLLVLEAYAGESVPQGTKWERDRSILLASALRDLTTTRSSHDVDVVIHAYRKSLKRLATHCVSPTLRWSLLAGRAAVSLAAPALAPAVGAAIGGMMGLSGAAATSAGLAFLGGGSLAAGGFGMAGGTILVVSTAKAGYFGARLAVSNLARQNAAALVVELAKLDVLTQLHPDVKDEVVQRLDRLMVDLELADGEPDDRKAVRAVRAEIRHLRDTPTQRTARLVTRFAPISALDRQIDRMRTTKTSETPSPPPES